MPLHSELDVTNYKLAGSVWTSRFSQAKCIVKASQRVAVWA